MNRRWLLVFRLHQSTRLLLLSHVLRVLFVDASNALFSNRDEVFPLSWLDWDFSLLFDHVIKNIVWFSVEFYFAMLRSTIEVFRIISLFPLCFLLLLLRLPFAFHALDSTLLHDRLISNQPRLFRLCVLLEQELAIVDYLVSQDKKIEQ